jgi:hypothetical protein
LYSFFSVLVSEQTEKVEDHSGNPLQLSEL